MSGRASQEVAENAIAQLKALEERRAESWYWDAYSDGSRSAWIYGQQSQKYAHEEGVAQGVFDAKSAMFGAMVRPNWNETYDPSWNQTNSTDYTATSGCVSGMSGC